MEDGGAREGGGGPFLPVFESDTGDAFSYAELRANFHIVNCPTLVIKLAEPASPDHAFDVRLRYEGEIVFQAPSRILEKQAPAAGEMPGEAEGAVSPGGPGRPEGDAASPAPVPRSLVAVPLLRGRNEIEISIPQETPARIEFPVFYKTALRDWVESILKALIILVLIQFFVIQTFYIPTGSMHPTLEPGDYIMVEKVSFLFRPPRRGDVVVFQFPEDPRKDFIKRMVAHEGDRVQVVRKKLSINGVELVEPYAVHDEQPEELWGRPHYRPFRDYYGPRTIPRRSIFVMGDNRDHSHDSRMWGDLPRFRLKGKAFLAYWPFSHFGLIRHQGGPFRNVGESPR